MVKHQAEKRKKEEEEEEAGFLQASARRGSSARSSLKLTLTQSPTDRPVPLRARVHQLHCHRSFCHALQTDLGAPPSRDLWRILVTSMWPYPYPILSRPVLILWLSYAPLALVSCHRCAFPPDPPAPTIYLMRQRAFFPFRPHLTSPRLPLLFPQLYLCR